MKLRKKKEKKKELKPRHRGEYKHARTLRSMTVVILAILLVLIGWTSYFVYDRVTGTIGQVQSIILLQSELTVEPIDFTKLDSVGKQWDMKHSATTTPILRDPFNPILPPASPDDTQDDS